jgi:TRAP-type C4-dicarboxylate transport system substrate-binding protein
MRIGQLHAGTLTLTGLVEIDNYFSVFGIPLYFDSYEEYFYVIEQLQPVLEKRLRDKGFVLINWGHGGWIHLFSTTPITTIKQLKKHKLFVWAGDDRMVTWYQRNGFRPVALQLPDVVTGLQTGMIDAMPSTPLAALALQWFRNAPYMLDMGFAPFLGATVVTERSWKKISPADQKAILEVSRKASLKFRTEIPIQDEKAVTEMSKRGLEVIGVTDDAALAEWRAATESFAANMRDSIVPPEIFDRAQKARQEFRSKQ